jgi:hypothetical protein
MANDQNPDFRTHVTIDDRIGETVKWKPATLASGRNSQLWVPLEESRDAFELVEKSLGNATPSFCPVKAGCLTKVVLGTRV